MPQKSISRILLTTQENMSMFDDMKTAGELARLNNIVATMVETVRMFNCGGNGDLEYKPPRTTSSL